MTKIAWTDESWNPVVGCTKISAGCKNCYAEKMACRLSAMEEKKTPFKPRYNRVVINGEWVGNTICREPALEIPLRWRKPRKIFVCSMGDLFHPSVPFEFIEKVFSVIDRCPQHTFQILTKRPKRMAEYIKGEWCKEDSSMGFGAAVMENFPNLWLGVTCENQKCADERIPILLQIPAAVRFVSIEPMLGAIQLNKIHPLDGQHWMRSVEGHYKALDWVIVGGESGPGARPMHPDWVRSIRDQCQAAGVPFFFKQWGEWGPVSAYVPTYRKRYFCFDPPSKATPHLKEYNGLSLANMYRYGKKKAGHLLDGKEYREYPKCWKPNH